MTHRTWDTWALSGERLFWWPHMRADIERFVCTQRSLPEEQERDTGSCRAVAAPANPWSAVTLDSQATCTRRLPGCCM
jgi:hypothetical protein